MAINNGFNARAVYADAVSERKKWLKEEGERKQALKSIYTAASAELGYTDEELANNKDKMLELVRLMFSDKYAGNKALNSLLAKDPAYSGFAAGSEVARQLAHKHALGLNYNILFNMIQGGDIHSLDDLTFTDLASKLAQRGVSEKSSVFLDGKVGTGMQEKKDNYAKLAEQDPHIGKLNSSILDFADVQRYAANSIAGNLSRASLEERVGVSLRGYDRAA